MRLPRRPSIRLHVALCCGLAVAGAALASRPAYAQSSEVPPASAPSDAASQPTSQPTSQPASEPKGVSKVADVAAIGPATTVYVHDACVRGPGCAKAVTDALLATPAVPRTVGISFAGTNRALDSTLEQLARLATHPKITEVTLTTSGVRGQTLETVLCALAKLPVIELTVRDGSAGSGALRCLPAFRRLATLGVYDLPLAAGLMKDLGAAASLTTLRLQTRHLRDADLRPLGGLVRLELLDLSNSPVTGAGFVALSSLPALETLVLLGTRVTNAALRHLAKLPRLASIDATETSVTATGFLPHLKGFPALKEVALSAEHETTPASRKLARRRPPIKVTYYGECMVGDE
ncbi:MAG: hypothetical protein IT371_31120 [Deltaproteobacteria bacterium]|nr:hypothetical protein [Deltaproteobacteria bacterium]